MTDEKNGVTKSSSNAEMSPQEDGTKVPLTADSPGEGVEVKFTSGNSPNGDARIDVGPVPTFSGLNKEELMKFSNDPFWIKVRWILFLFFWFAWLVMLVAAIVIIVFTPGCSPPPTLEWIQESPMLDINVDDAPEDIIELMDSMKIKTAYIPEVINPDDFDELVETSREKLMLISEAITSSEKRIATDFISNEVPDSHIWKENHTHFLDGTTLDYTNPGLIEGLETIFSNWVDKGFAGFIADAINSPAEQEAIDEINKFMKEEETEGVIVSGIVDMKSELQNFADPNVFSQFLEKHVANVSEWNYFKYDPFSSVGSASLNHNHLPLITMALFLVPGTPILKINPALQEANTTIHLVNELATFREDSAIKFGNITYFNSETSNSLVAYTRIQKGVPGYAVAVNLESKPHTIDFSKPKHMPEKGKLSLVFSNGQLSKGNDEEVDLSKVELEGLEGKIIGFVPKY